MWGRPGYEKTVHIRSAVCWLVFCVDVRNISIFLHQYRFLEKIMTLVQHETSLSCVRVRCSNMISDRKRHAGECKDYYWLYLRKTAADPFSGISRLTWVVANLITAAKEDKLSETVFQSSGHVIFSVFFVTFFHQTYVGARKKYPKKKNVLA